jgi:hypothetical protein
MGPRQESPDLDNLVEPIGLLMTCHTGGYQVCEKWLKDPQGRRLELDDIRTYCRIVTALKQTIDIQGEINALCPGIEKEPLSGLSKA